MYLNSCSRVSEGHYRSSDAKNKRVPIIRTFIPNQEPKDYSAVDTSNYAGKIRARQDIPPNLDDFRGRAKTRSRAVYPCGGQQPYMSKFEVLKLKFILVFLTPVHTKFIYLYARMPPWKNERVSCSLEIVEDKCRKGHRLLINTLAQAIVPLWGSIRARRS